MSSSRSPRVARTLRRAASKESAGTSSIGSRYNTPEPDDAAPSLFGGGLIQHIFGSPDFIVSCSNQYQPGGMSACGLAALNCVRVLLRKEQDGIRAEALLREMSARETFQEITSICAEWSGSAHLEVEEIVRIPLFHKCFTSWGTYFERPGVGAFRDVLNRLQEFTTKGTSAAVIIARPPEIVACLKIATPFGDVFAVFDPLPRPGHSDGAAFIFNTSVDATAKQLSELMAVDRQLLNERGIQWQAQLLTNFSALFLKAKTKDGGVSVLKKIIFDTSLQLLHHQGENTAIRESNNDMKDAIRSLQEQSSTLVAANAQLQEELDALQQDLAAARRRNEQESPSWFSSVWSTASSNKDKQRENNNNSRHQYDLRSRYGSPRSSHTRSRSPSHRNLPTGSPPRTTTPPHASGSRIHSSALRAEPSSRTLTPSLSVFPNDRDTSSKKAKAPVPRIDQDDLLLAQRLHMELNSSAIGDATLASRLQREFEAESHRLVEEQRELLGYVQPTFECQVCLEEVPEDDIARVPGCEHTYCRDCLRGYIMSRVGEHRYPILCPSCTASTTEDPTVINDALVREIGIPEREYAILEEMSLASLSIMLHCRQCENSFFVARDEYEEMKVLGCPLPNCHYMWCKQCQQPANSEDEHSCDGSKEFESLMNLRGWKYCPGCRTPIQKETGCNHMTCTSPGCNMHFCYRCGERIIASAVAGEVRQAISTHYARCSLFEELPDRPTPP